MRPTRILVYLLMLLTGLAAVPAQAAWKQASSPHFIVYSDGSESELKSFAEKLEQFDYFLRLMTNAKGPDNSAPVRVYLVSSADRVQMIAGQKNIGGYYSLGPRYGYAVATRERAGGDRENLALEVLFHEYTHHFMLHYFTAAYPSWYVEGFAEYFSTVSFSRSAVEMGKMPAGGTLQMLSMGIYPLKTLFSKSPDLDRDLDAGSYYATAWLLTHFLRVSPERNKEMVRYLSDIANAKPDIDPESYFSGGLAAMQKELSSYEQKGTNYQEMKLTTPPAAVTIAALPADENALIYQQVAILNGARGDGAKALVADIDAATARFPDSAYAWGLKAQANEIADMDDAALAAAARAVALSPKAAVAMGVAARILLDRAAASGKADDMETARSMIVDANRADTEDPVPLMLYFDYYAMQPKKPPQTAYDGLTKALTLLPQSGQIRFILAQARAQNGEYAIAANLLAPMAGNPHGGKSAETARKLRERYLIAVKTGKLPAESPAPAAAE